MKRTICDNCNQNITDIPEEGRISLQGALIRRGISGTGYEEFDFCNKECFLEFIEEKINK